MSGPTLQKINLISCGPMTHISDIKLIRTDTTLDLSQKAEKGMIIKVFRCVFYKTTSGDSYLNTTIWGLIMGASDMFVPCNFRVI
ncbi:hypothetical protein AAZX31_06G192400 [Glycine max]